MEARYSDPGIGIIEILPVGFLMPGPLSNGALVLDALYPLISTAVEDTLRFRSISIRVSLSPDIKTAVLKAAFDATLDHS